MNSVESHHVRFLQRAAAEGEVAMLNFLMDAGVDVNLRDSLEGTALGATARKGNTAVVRRILQAGAEKKAIDLFEQTTLMELRCKAESIPLTVYLKLELILILEGSATRLRLKSLWRMGGVTHRSVW